VVKGSTDGDGEWNWGAQIQGKERWSWLRIAYAVAQPIHAEHGRVGMEVKSLYSNW
jgi:hypothetical protein